MDTNGLVSAVASRLLIKRAGVDFHPLKNLHRKSNEKLANFRSRVQEERANEVSNGVEAVDTVETTDETKEVQNSDGTTSQVDTGVTEAAEEAKGEIQAVAKDSSKGVIKDIIKKLGKGGVAVGLLCAVKSFGKDIPNFKYMHIVLPMIRMGMNIITIGNQVMNGRDVNMDELGALSAQMDDTDPVTHKNSSFFQAKSILAAEGEDDSGGTAIPPEADLRDVNGKPVIFNAIDNIPLLQQACDVSGAVGSIPLIGSAINWASDQVLNISNGTLSSLGLPTLDDIMEGALKLAAGKSVDPLSSGGEFGALADTGAFLAANDNAISMGGGALTPTQTAELNSYENDDAQESRSAESFASRYLNPYDYSSLVGNMIDKVPTSVAGTASVFSDLLKGLVGSLDMPLRLIGGTAAAVAKPYDYGLPQFGFSIAEQQDPRFEDPYENARIVEGIGVAKLSNEYKECFGMTVSADSTGVHVQSSDMGDDSVNMVKISANSKCHDGSENLLRYRFYLADAVSTTALNCAELDDEQACQDLSTVGSSDTTANADCYGITHPRDGGSGCNYPISSANVGSSTGDKTHVADALKSTTPKNTTQHHSLTINYQYIKHTQHQTLGMLLNITSTRNTGRTVGIKPLNNAKRLKYQAAISSSNTIIQLPKSRVTVS